MAPNIFKYATKELSQDAVICWLVSCAREATGELRECGVSFVQTLMRSDNSRVINAQNSKIQALDEGSVMVVHKEPSTQYSNIDVYFRVKWGSKLVGVIIEDKVQTEMHGDQLERYLATIGTDSNEELYFVKAIYLKTGYVFDDEREEAKRAGYCVFDAEDIDHFFRNGRWSATHPFVRDFVEHVSNLINKRQVELDNWDLDQDFVQWKFMVALRDAFMPGDMRWPARWFNIGGSAWTQYPHWKDRDALFWRLDSWMPLRLMVDSRKVDHEHLLASWDEWDNAFIEATELCDLNPAPFRRIRTRNGNVVAEGTIGAVDIRNCLQQEGLEECVERVHALHQQFVDVTGPL